MKWCCTRAMAVSTSLICAAAGVLVALLGAPRDLVVEEVAVAMPGWAESVEPARMVLLADLHAGPEDADWVDEQVAAAISLRPEAIILLGDYHKSDDEALNMPMEELARRLAPLREHCPVYYVMGNHDRGRRRAQVKTAFDAVGFTFVENKDTELQFANGCRAVLRGMAFRSENLSPGGQLRRFSAERLPTDCPLLVATHSPFHFFRYELHGELVMTGHTHGGMVCWPGGSPLVSIGRWETDELRGGLHAGKVEGQQVYVSRGTGTSSFPMRVFCSPEITLLLLKGSAEPLRRAATAD